MVVLEMVHEVSAVSFHLLIARYSAEHNLGETFTEKRVHLNSFLLLNMVATNFVHFFLTTKSSFSKKTLKSRSNRVLYEKLRRKKGFRIRASVDFYSDFYPDPIANKILNTDPNF
jgi:hypothetical protein